MTATRLATHLERRLAVNVEGLPVHVIWLGRSAARSLRNMDTKECTQSVALQRHVMADLRIFVEAHDAAMKSR